MGQRGHCEVRGGKVVGAWCQVNSVADTVRGKGSRCEGQCTTRTLAWGASVV